ncbi:MAG TPA: M23 family metallopeptidase [Pyrinomonadaceae bacterium]|nr:M23 family metallopeptidase [Pyrinomonadaceae bacterium]
MFVPDNMPPLTKHPNFSMKRRWKTLVVVGMGLFLLVITGAGGALADTLVFYARVAKLYTEEPHTKIKMPVADVTKREVADTWGAPRSGGRRHEGQDIFAPKGTRILSATNGYVYRIGENNLGGQTVSVISSGGRVYYYAHLDAYAPGLEVGDRVSTNTLLGFVGTTGNAQGTPPHLHFGIYSMSGAINPLPLITDRPAPTITRTTPSTRPVRRITNRVRVS